MDITRQETQSIKHKNLTQEHTVRTLAIKEYLFDSPESLIVSRLDYVICLIHLICIAY